MAKTLCRAEGTITNNHISAIMEGDCDAPIENGTLLLTYVIETQMKLNTPDFEPGTTLEQVIQDVVSRGTRDFDGLISMATDSMKTDKPNGVRVSFIASAHTGCETCEGAEDCPVWVNANAYQVALIADTKDDGAEDANTENVSAENAGTEGTGIGNAGTKDKILRLLH